MSSKWLLLSQSFCSKAPRGRRGRPLSDLLPCLPPPMLAFMVRSYILLRVAAGVDHHIWRSAWGRLVSCHVPAIPWRYASASPRRFGVFSFAFANEILSAWLSTGRLSLWISPWQTEQIQVEDESPIYLTPLNHLGPLRLRTAFRRDLTKRPQIW